MLEQQVHLVDIAEWKAYSQFMEDAGHMGLQEEAWIWFMREYRKGVTVYAAIRYTRKHWMI